MTTTSTPMRSGGPEDPDGRYQRDAWEQREARRVEAARAAAEAPLSHTPSGPIRVVAGLVTVLLVLAAGLALVGPMLKQTETTDQALPAGVSRVQVDNGVGDVRVRVAETGESPRVTSTVEWGLRRPTADVDASDSTASLRGQCPANVVSVCRTDWLVVVPAGTTLDLQQGVGEVSVEGLEGDVDIEAGVGDVAITDGRSQAIDVQLGVGELRIESIDPPQDVRARLGVGDLTVRLPDSVDYRIDAKGGASEVRNDLGSSPDAERRVVLETGVGSLTVQPS